MKKQIKAKINKSDKCFAAHLAVSGASPERVNSFRRFAIESRSAHENWRREGYPGAAWRSDKTD